MSANPYEAKWEPVYQVDGNPFDIDIDEALKWVKDLESAGLVSGTVLDAGCATGHNALYLASRGYSVVGVDVSPSAIDRARSRASAHGLAVEFLHGDVRELAGWVDRFDTVVDIGCLHSLRDADRESYVSALHRACRPGALVHVRCFTDANQPFTDGTATVPRQRLVSLFASGWSFEKLAEAVVMAGVPRLRPVSFWLASVRRL
jgi:cyclopropane fatty-acyl-phospholipid synthase-like methyltransferase